MRPTDRNRVRIHGTWSRVNRQRAAGMIELGLMTEHGQALIELAKANGTWEVLPDGESSAILDDLQELLDRNEAARKNFENFPPSSKRLILEWIATAKKPDTRQRRINQTVTLAAVNIRAKHPGIRVRVGRSGGDRRCQLVETAGDPAVVPTADACSAAPVTR